MGLSGSADFSITMAPDPIVGSGMTTQVEIAFAPSAAGYVSATLEIESNDPGNPFVSVSLAGMGVGQEEPPTSVGDILAFFDESVEAGTLQGTGTVPWLREWRLYRMRNMIERAGYFIDNGWIELACWQLERTDKRCDGMSWPPDLVEGEDTPELNAMILALMADLGC